MVEVINNTKERCKTCRDFVPRVRQYTLWGDNFYENTVTLDCVNSNDCNTVKEGKNVNSCVQNNR